MNDWKSTTEILAVESAIADAINNDLKRGKGTLRDEADRLAVEMYEATGAKTFDLTINDEKVGTYSVTVKEECEESGVTINDPGAFVAWCIENDCVATLLQPNMKAVEEWFCSTGEVPDGCEAFASIVPKRVSGTTLRIGKDFKARVAQMLDEKVLNGAKFAALLNGGE